MRLDGVINIMADSKTILFNPKNYIFLTFLVLKGCGTSVLYHENLPSLTPKTTKQEISVSTLMKPTIFKVKFSDVDVYARPPTLEYVVERTGIKGDKYHPDSPKFSGSPFGIALGLRINSASLQLDPYKIALDIQGQEPILPSVVYSGEISRWTSNCITHFNPATNQWDGRVTSEPKGKIHTIERTLSSGANKTEYYCLTLMYPVATPNANEVFSLRLGEGRIPEKPEQIIYFTPAIVEYGRPN